MRLYLERVSLAQQATVRALGARKEYGHGWWVDDTWPDLRRFDRWLPATALVADIRRNLNAAVDRIERDIRFGEP